MAQRDQVQAQNPAEILHEPVTAIESLGIFGLDALRPKQHALGGVFDLLISCAAVISSTEENRTEVADGTRVLSLVSHRSQRLLFTAARHFRGSVRRRFR